MTNRNLVAQHRYRMRDVHIDPRGECGGSFAQSPSRDGVGIIHAAIGDETKTVNAKRVADVKRAIEMKRLRHKYSMIYAKDITRAIATVIRAAASVIEHERVIRHAELQRGLAHHFWLVVFDEAIVAGQQQFCHTASPVQFGSGGDAIIEYWRWFAIAFQSRAEDDGDARLIIARQISDRWIQALRVSGVRPRAEAEADHDAESAEDEKGDEKVLDDISHDVD